MKVSETLERYGLLLQQDKKLPSVVGLITGEALSGSWWSHPKGRQIFATLDEIVDSGDVLVTRLIARKVTFVHRKLWPALVAVGTSREEWQTKGLSKAGRGLLARIDANDGVVLATGTAARELQDRLLVASMQVHTDEGKHAMALQPWPKVRRMKVDAAKRQLEEATVALGGTVKMLPWRKSAG